MKGKSPKKDIKKVPKDDAKKGNALAKIGKVIRNIIINIGKGLKKIRINKKVVYCILGILVLFLLIKIFAPKNIDYPVVFNDTDGDLYLITPKAKNIDSGVKLATSETASKVKYANETERYVLFQKEENLYLYDAKKKGETKKIVNNVSGTNYYFSDDDKFIIALDESKNLKVYNYKEASKIDNNVTKIVSISGDYILYEKDNEILIRNIKPSKDKTEKIVDSSVSSISFSNDSKYVMYLNNENELHRYNIKKNSDDKIANNVSNYYCDEESCEKLMYVKDDGGKFLYYYDGKKDVELASDIFTVLAQDVEAKKVIYSKANGNKFNLFYKKGNKEEAKIDESLNGLKSVRLLDNDIYYLTSDNKLKFAKISGARISRKLTVSDDVFGYLYEYKKGFAYITDVDDYYNGTLYVAKNGKGKKITDKVGASTLKVNKDGDRIYFIKGFGEEGELRYTKGRKSKLIDSKVHTYEYVRDNLLYLVKDYSSSKARGDLYRYTNKSVKIADEISRIASSPVVYEKK